MSDCMTFPDTVEEFMEQYKVVDTDGIYMSNGAELVPIFRMRQWFEHLPSAQPEKTQLSEEDTTKDTTPDCISRQEAIDALGERPTVWTTDDEYSLGARNQYDTDKLAIETVPSAQPEPSTEIQEILEYLDTTLHPIVSPDNWNVYSELHDMVSRLTSAQPEDWMEQNKDRILKAGMEGREVEFRIGGRLFAIREKAQ